ncbi:MAG: enoyl-CoA hydratase/isomerase family protein [Acidimicrobiales bacterium]|nr:enoyl-CoA hydratase/isomerase family protein [Acidimicrobiales bacterium]
MPEYATITYAVEGAVATVTLNRPDRLNAITVQMTEEIQSVWRALRFDDSVRAVVLTASGDRAFSSGIDRGEVVDQPPSPYMVDDPLQRLGPKGNDLWKPVIAAVNGMACGGAFYLLGEADIIIAAEHATFFDPHVTYGQCAVWEPIHMLSRMPIGEITRLTLMGNHERMSARRAYDVGLISEVAPSDQLAARARWIAECIASQPAAAVEGSLRAIWAAKELSRRQALEMAPHLYALGTVPEAIEEGQQAFASGQRIEWQLR